MVLPGKALGTRLITIVSSIYVVDDYFNGKNIFLSTRIKGAEPRIVRLEKFGLKFSSSSFIIRVNLLYTGY